MEHTHLNQPPNPKIVLYFDFMGLKHLESAYLMGLNRNQQTLEFQSRKYWTSFIVGIYELTCICELCNRWIHMDSPTL